MLTKPNSPAARDATSIIHADPSQAHLEKGPVCEARFNVNREISLQIRAFFAECTPHRALPLDEAYLNLTENLKGIESATQIADPFRGRCPGPTRTLHAADLWR